MNKQRFKKLPLAATSFLGGVAGILISLIFVLIGAVLIQNESVAPQSGYYIIIIGQAISVFLSCMLAGKIVDGKIIPSCIASGSIYYLIIITAAILFFDGIGSRFLWGTIATILGIACCILVVNRGNKAGKRKRRVRRFR